MTDFVLEAWVSGLVELAKIEWMMGAGNPWKPGEKLKLLFAGYNGTRNTGSDVRVEEMLRQVRQILGAQNLDLSVMSQNFDLTRGYFGDARQVRLPDLFPPFLWREVPKNHGVVACEGSMFKSKFANALAVMMIGSLGIAAAENKISVAYGAEAGHMDVLVEKMCARYCHDSLVITRNPESAAILRKLGVPTETGTDTAWTFEPLPPEYGRKILREHGWDGSAPILAVCPIHPFWWPVKASLWKGAAFAVTGAYRKSHYRSLYFHHAGRDVDLAYKRYLDALAGAINRYRKSRDVFIILIAMERLDRDACHRTAELLGGATVFTSEDFNMYQLVSILRCSSRILSSRYHAIVTSMPAGIPSAGITMDERIRNLMAERGQPHLSIEADDPALEQKTFDALQTLDRDADAVAGRIRRTVARNLRLMARMGVYFEESVARVYPDFPFRKGVLGWEDYLPPLNPSLRELAETCN